MCIRDSYTSSSGNTYVYAPNFVIYGSMDANDLRSLLDLSLIHI